LSPLYIIFPLSLSVCYVPLICIVRGTIETTCVVLYGIEWLDAAGRDVLGLPMVHGLPVPAAVVLMSPRVALPLLLTDNNRPHVCQCRPISCWKHAACWLCSLGCGHFPPWTTSPL